MCCQCCIVEGPRVGFQGFHHGDGPVGPHLGDGDGGCSVALLACRLTDSADVHNGQTLSHDLEVPSLKVDQQVGLLKWATLKVGQDLDASMIFRFS